MHTLDREPARELKMNDIASVEFEAAAPLFFDPYERNRTTGSFILIDPLSNATVGAAMIRRDLSLEHAASLSGAPDELWKAPVTPQDRYQRHGHDPALLLIEGRPLLAEYLEQALFAQGYEVLLVSGDEVPVDHLEAMIRFSWSVGLVLIVAASAIGDAAKHRWQAQATDRFIDLTARDLPADDEQAVPSVLALLRSIGGKRAAGNDSGEVQ
jgi:hypothetical protein